MISSLQSVMGRVKYSEEERGRIVESFLRCTREVIELEGIEHVSIRRIAQCAGFNSATMYLYFKDVDELITLSCISYLENYYRGLSADLVQLETPYELYVHSWRVFAQHAFASPKIYEHLFFHPHSIPLSQTIARYYELYPNQMPVLEERIQEMLLEGDIRIRNMKLLRQPAKNRGFHERQMEMINDLMICYFKMLLEEHQAESGMLASQRQVEKVLEMIEFLFHYRLV